MTTLAIGNILGETTAESDGRMLGSAFYESRSYQELILGSDFRFVVGRRGAGKSALFQKVSEAVRDQPATIVLTEHPAEEKVIAYQEALSRIADNYGDIRPITRLTWRTQIFTSCLESILDSYKIHRVDNPSDLQLFRATHASLFQHKGLARSLEALRIVQRANPGAGAKELPERIADYFQLGKLQKDVSAALHAIKHRVVFFYDGLDEGWLPSQSTTGILGGLAKAAGEFREASQSIRCVLFIRDNMLRALAEFDDDYSRNIENSTLRVQWNEETLLKLVALRIRAALQLAGEQDIRAWNRFAERGLEGKPGFRKCLQLTLYRPRDVITLLNHAYQDAVACERSKIIEDDIDAAATRISRARLGDLYKEYERVLPGLPTFWDSFRGAPSRASYSDVKARLEAVASSAHAGAVARDFALLSTGAEALNALYSVGFVGIQDRVEDSVRFCHDGSNTNVAELDPQATVVVHPCYWRALDVQQDSSEVLVRVDDEDDVVRTETAKRDVQDLRLRKLGRVVEDINKIPIGTPGAYAFEEWVLTTSKYLFAKGLDNIQRNPNPGALERRDIVGTNRAEFGFWKRLDKYDVAQFVIECKNFEQMRHDEFRQAWAYLKGPYGRCMMIVTRSSQEAIDETERALVMEGYNDSVSSKMVILMPAFLLARAISKMRSTKEGRDDWINEQMCKRLDTFERSYIAPRAPRRRKPSYRPPPGA